MSITVAQEQVSLTDRYRYASIPPYLKATACALATNADSFTGKCVIDNCRLHYFTGRTDLEIQGDLEQLRLLGLLIHNPSSGKWFLHLDPQSLFPCTLGGQK